MLNLNVDKSSAVLLSIFVLVAFGLLNGLYKETLNVLSPPAFWAGDALQFVIVPVAVVAALWRYGNTLPKEYGLGSRFGGMPPKKLFALTCVIALVLYLGLGRPKDSDPYGQRERWPAQGQAARNPARVDRPSPRFAFTNRGIKNTALFASRPLTTYHSPITDRVRSD